MGVAGQELFHSEYNSSAEFKAARIKEILACIEETGTYSHTFDELQHGLSLLLPCSLCQLAGCTCSCPAFHMPAAPQNAYLVVHFTSSWTYGLIRMHLQKYDSHKFRVHQQAPDRPKYTMDQGSLVADVMSCKGVF